MRLTRRAFIFGALPALALSRITLATPSQALLIAGGSAGSSVSRQIQVPGSGYINESGTFQAQVPGGAYMNEGGA